MNAHAHTHTHTHNTHTLQTTCESAIVSVQLHIPVTLSVFRWTTLQQKQQIQKLANITLLPLLNTGAHKSMTVVLCALFYMPTARLPMGLRPAGGRGQGTDRGHCSR